MRKRWDSEAGKLVNDIQDGADSCDISAEDIYAKIGEKFEITWPPQHSEPVFGEAKLPDGMTFEQLESELSSIDPE